MNYEICCLLTIKNSIIFHSIFLLIFEIFWISIMIKRLEKKFKNVEHENEMSDYLENFDVFNQRDELLEQEEEPQRKKGKENYFCSICKINFLKNEETLNLHLESKVIISFGLT